MLHSTTTTSPGLGQLGAADSARPTRRRQLADGTIRRRANSTRAIRCGDIRASALIFLCSVVIPYNATTVLVAGAAATKPPPPPVIYCEVGVSHLHVTESTPTLVHRASSQLIHQQKQFIHHIKIGYS